jgi:hypothetical protein
MKLRRGKQASIRKKLNPTELYVQQEQHAKSTSALMPSTSAAVRPVEASAVDFEEEDEGDEEAGFSLYSSRDDLSMGSELTGTSSTFLPRPRHNPNNANKQHQQQGGGGGGHQQ